MLSVSGFEEGDREGDRGEAEGGGLTSSWTTLS